jgi:hypothetical protein
MNWQRFELQHNMQKLQVQMGERAVKSIFPDSMQNLS